MGEARDRVAYVATVAFALSFYSAIHRLVPALEPLRPALVASTLAFLALLAGRWTSKQPVALDGLRGGLLLAITGLAYASAKWSVYPPASKEFAVEFAKELAIYVTVANVVSSAERLRWVVLACVVGGIAPGWGAVKNYRLGLDLVDGFRARWEGVYADPNHLAMALVFLVPLCLCLLARGRPWERAAGAACLLSSIAGIVVTHSRGGALGLLFATTVWALREPKKARSLLIMGALSVAFVLLAPKSFWNRTETIADYQQDVSALGRVHAWEVARAINLDRPLLGVGAGAFVFAWPLYAPWDARGEQLVAHNIFLQMLGDLGFVGMLMLLLFTASALTEGGRAGRAEGVGPWARAVYAGACGYLLCDLSAGYVLSFHFFFAMGLLGAAGRIAKAAEPATMGAWQPATPF